MKRTPPPWIYIVAGWLLLVLATVLTVRVCNQNAPQQVPEEEPQLPAHAH